MKDYLMITVITATGGIVETGIRRSHWQTNQKKTVPMKLLSNGLQIFVRHRFKDTASVSSSGAKHSQQQHDLQQRPQEVSLQPQGKLGDVQ